jgi:DNA mismatch endonuclease, patch repair protein
MSDVFSKKKRSEVMARIRGKGNKSTELFLARLLRKNKVTGWRRHAKRIMGRPDFSWANRKVALFVDGCFWHGCPRCFQKPKNNWKFWAEKIAANKRRDNRVNRALRRKGWKVIRIWEHSLVKQSTVFQTMHRLKTCLEMAN